MLGLIIRTLELDVNGEANINGVMRIGSYATAGYNENGGDIGAEVTSFPVNWIILL